MGLEHAPRNNVYRDTSLIRRHNPSKDHRRALGIALLQGPRVERFLVSEVTL